MSEPDRRWAAETVFYGIDITRFHDANGDGIGDVSGLVEKLDYVADLGVTCLWLLPFFPSDRMDNGYDITNYFDVDPELGTLDDFRALADEAHARGIRIMVDLVVHHTASKHPWFRAAQADPDSRFYDYYIWREDEPADSADKSAFPEEEDGIWDYSPRAKRYYRHTFYEFQPDLRIADDQLWETIKSIVDFWVATGADAFRVDAASKLFTPDALEGTQITGQERLDDLRRYLSRRAPGVALIGEVDMPRDDIEDFLGDRFDLLYNFLGNNALYLALARQEAEPLRETFRQQQRSAGTSPWLNFMRNLDELDLEQLSDDERQRVFDVFASRQDMRIYGRGVRRGWAPMMKTHEQRRMCLSLLFASPGAPLLVYGQELGMGDELSLSGREAVRIPMQWDSSRSGGFSARAPARDIARTANRAGEFGYRRVNVEKERDKPDSLLTLTRQLVRLRCEHPGIGTIAPKFPDEPSDAILALSYGELTIVHNLSEQAQPTTIEHGRRVLLGGIDGTTLPPFGFAWLTDE
ncbi:alpha-amylase family glycosyl hydrolase [Microbacterium sp. STN6]|uniref:alpha-amylase family glycosyl hydrolase n=1 Tax=Microbacterium sp. STN6 TaxID=2995588 RepID=UPI002260C728|nr:alpha-amylase family glycosyl hydrolase [Microbacterium sp. STN6]MCX7521454.1 alpha-amylase family glycosyl hydrolase [Microbacterium sp. STN6]